MEDDFSTLRLHVQNLQHDVEFLQKCKTAEFTRCEQIEIQLRKLRQDFEQSSAEQKCLKQNLRLSEYRVQELEAELRNALQENCRTKTMTSNNIQNISDNAEAELIDADEEIEILEIKPALTKRRQTDLLRRPSRILDASFGSEVQSDGRDPSPTVTRTSSSNSSEPRHCTVNLGQRVNTEVGKPSPASAFKVQTEPNGFQSLYIGKPSSCKLCGKQFLNLARHMKTRHKARSGNKWVWACLRCPKIYQTCQGLKLHYKATHCSIRYKCRMCNKIYKDPNSTRKHAKDKHGFAGKTKEIIKELHNV